MNSQKTSANGGRKNKIQKDGLNNATEQNNNINVQQPKKHTNINAKDSINNNVVDSSQPKAEKDKNHAKPTAEQIRIAQITELKSGNQDPTPEKVRQLMEATERSEEDACLALYECDNDVERAVVYLLENLEIGAVITTSKKKKNKASAADGEEDSTINNQQSPRDDQRSRNQRHPAAKGKVDRGGRPRPPQTGESHSDRNNSNRPPRALNSRRGGFSGVRGGRGGRIMGRGGRDQNFRAFRSNQDQQEIDNWDPASTQNNEKNDETWGDLGDWDNEEYTGSLSDTKVFTPSSHVPSSGGHDISAPPGLEQALLQGVSSHNEVQQYSAAVVSNASTLNAGNQFDHSASSTSSQLRQALEIPQTLTAEQSQYFNTLSSQNNNMVQYSFEDQSGVNQTSGRQQQRTRARMPPPSKIPSSAVEMPGDGMNVYLNVQFGELDFGTGGNEESYDNEKFGTTAIDQTTAEDYSLKAGNGVSKTQAGGLQSLSDASVDPLSTGYPRSTNAQAALDQLNVNQKSAGFQSGSYGSNFSQTTNNYAQSSNNYGYGQNSYPQGQSLVQNAAQSQSNNSSNGITSGSATSNTSGYMSNQFPSNQASFSSQPNNFQNQSVYSSNNSDSNNAVSGSSSSSNSNTISTSTINTSTLGLNTKSAPSSKSSQVSSVAGITGTTNTVGSSNATNNNVVQNIPLVSSFIQPGYYQQSPYLHFEDMQLVQPRMTPMTGYYEYQTPTSLGTGRDGASASSLASVAYPMTADGRFARTDNNSSPVQSQQTGSSQQLMNIPPYAYFYGTNVMPSGFQQFPQIYSQMQVTNPNAGQFAKQTAYNSGYGSTSYDAINPTNQDYKTAYQSAGQQSKGSNQTASSSELTSSMYNKSHVTLNKVNSYDKQSFHSGTPPPFNMAGSQANSQTQAFQQHLYLQPMAPHHNINMHQPVHQGESNRLSGSRRDSNNTGQRQQLNSQNKGTKTSYQSPSYWNTQN